MLSGSLGSLGEVMSSCCVSKRGSWFGTWALVRCFGRGRGCPTRGPLRWTGGGLEIFRRQCRRSTSFSILRLGSELNSRICGFERLWALILITKEFGKGILAMNTKASRSYSLRRGGTIGELENWNKTPWKINWLLGLVMMPSLGNETLSVP